jgi:peroxiredoxin (alkyl hydroperoxide reductase subunit C)
MSEAAASYTSKAKIGRPAPDFSMKTTANLESLAATATLTDYRGKWLVLLFYPLDFSPLCPTELLAMNERYEELQEVGAEVLGVSTDSVYSHRAWIQTPRSEGGLGGLHFPLAADMTRQASRDYGVLIEEEGIALRGLFIIDPEGVLQYSTVTNLNIGRSVDETLRVLMALQTGGLCPADWKPGKNLLFV